MFDFGKIVLIPFPFTDLTSAKLRPALIVSGSPENDVVVLFITSRKPDGGKYFQLETDEDDFSDSGLKTTSYIRLDKIATLNKKLVIGELGFLSKAILKKIKPGFFSVFGF